jgi:single-strand DNA-binding protein
MANDINRIFMIGRLTKDPDLRYTQGGTSVASFSIANNRSYTAQNERKEAVSYFNCIAWGKSGEVIAQHCKKGQRIGLEGRLQQRSWQDQGGQKRNTVEIVVENFQFLDAKGPGGERSDFVPAQKEQAVPAQDDQSSQAFYSEADSSPHFSDDDIPF